MIVLAESAENLPPSASLRDIKANTEAARLAGATIYSIPPDFSLCENAHNALWQLPHCSERTQGLWIGYIPDSQRYRDIYAAASQKNVVLLNSPEEHLRAQEFDAAYPFLKGITPRSHTITNATQCVQIAADLGFPLFVKGAIQSRKARGWKACVAENVDDLLSLTNAMFELENRSRGRVVVRELVRLRHTREHNGFPLGREYRVFLFHEEILGLGYYWEGEDDLKELNSLEREQVGELAKETARRMKVPFLSVDIGQKEDGEWIVIETGDPQFSGLSQINPLRLWARLAQTINA